MGMVCSGPQHQFLTLPLAVSLPSAASTWHFSGYHPLVEPSLRQALCGEERGSHRGLESSAQSLFAQAGFLVDSEASAW